MSNDIAQARAQHQELQKLVRTEQQTVAEFLLRLMEFEREKMHERLGYATMWDFCQRGLGLSESTTGRRLKAIKLVGRFPFVVDYLRDGRLCTTRMLLLFDALTPENAADLFDQASRKSMREIELLVATAKPQPASTVRFQKLPEPRAVVAAPALAFGAVAAMPTCPPEVPAEALPCPPPAVRRSEIHPTSAQEYVARLPVSRGWVEKLEMAKKLGSHVVPTHDPVAILELALDLFIEKHGKRRGAIAVKPAHAATKTRELVAAAETLPETETAAEVAIEAQTGTGTVTATGTATATPPAIDAPAPARTTAKRGRFTAAELRQIWSRDGGRCTWRMDSGDLCGSEWQLEVDHIDAVAKGGATELSRARLLCRRHNDQHARETFGEEFMHAKKARPGMR